MDAIKVMEWDEIPQKMEAALELPEHDIRRDIMCGLLPELAAMSLREEDYLRAMADIASSLRAVLRRIERRSGL